MSSSATDEPRRRRRFGLRDWRLWASMSVAMLVACVTIAFVTVVAQNNEYRATIRVQSTQQECRSAAAVFADTVGAQGTIILNLGLAAFGGGQTLDPYVAALTVSGDNYRVALAARTAAVETCTTDPAYRIDPAILAPLPEFPHR